MYMYIWHQFSSRDEYTSDHEQKYLRVYTKIYLFTTKWTLEQDVDCASLPASIVISITIGEGSAKDWQFARSRTANSRWR